MLNAYMMSLRGFLSIAVLALGAGAARIGRHRTAEALAFTLGNVSSWLKEAGITHVFFHGTALGLERDGGVIEGDDDVDLLVLMDDMPKLRRTLWAHAAGVYDEDFEVMGSRKGACFMRTDFAKPEWAALDVYADTGGEEYVCEPHDKRAWPRSAIFPPKFKTFQVANHSLTLPVPADGHEFLRIDYGDGWNVKAANKGNNSAANALYLRKCVGQCSASRLSIQFVLLSCFDALQVAWFFVTHPSKLVQFCRTWFERNQPLLLTAMFFVVMLYLVKWLACRAAIPKVRS
eukprot:TRINITY_DN10908_c0_g1_i2.p1 TRINITY_DN10908_c0_g1~~TRINITY_DN10908_c0_g1_i2.p1  ORF type:complete len:306 (+),score=44.34 TRINITY_DN10908_c0_g1_i2:53-919(+)